MGKANSLQQVRNMLDDADGVAFGKLGSHLDEIAAACDQALKEQQALVAALEAIAEGAPTEEPEDCGSTGNSDDNRDYGSEHAHWYYARIARAALSKAGA